MIFEPEDFDRAIHTLEKQLQLAKAEHKGYLEELLAVIKEGLKHKDIRKFQSLFYDNEWTILDYLPKGTPVFLMISKS